ncbi:MAG TPA: DUF6600 domain-containing protein [Verrucomicrobiae bacterium]|nr:DUF6600 domain-containing protein [Verrucomicrobiae bacterium]
MKMKLLILLCAVTGFLSVSAVESTAGVSWSVSVFDGPLGRCGHWIDRPGYGHCWYPAYVSSDWRPYCEGYWMWTDSGWYWVSTEEWGWATYHYGRWDYDSYYGWVWVPDTEWAPSWVEWREGDEYVGWAPLPPGAYYGPEGYVFAREHPIHDNFFVFVQVGHFAEPIHRRAVIVNNTTIINKTVNITRVTRVNNVLVNNGPKVENIQRVSSRKLTEPPPHTTFLRSSNVTPRTERPSPGEVPRPPEREVKTVPHEPEVVHGTPGAASEATRSKAEVEKPERPKKVESTPPEAQRTYQNFGTAYPRTLAPVEPDSVQPKQHAPPPQHEDRTVEKRSESRQQGEGRDEKPKKGDQGGN